MIPEDILSAAKAALISDDPDVRLEQVAAAIMAERQQAPQPVAVKPLEGPNDNIEAEVAAAEVQWMLREDNHRYPRDFWHARLSAGGFDTGWRLYGEQEQSALTEEETASAEAELREEYRAHLTWASSLTTPPTDIDSLREENDDLRDRLNAANRARSEAINRGNQLQAAVHAAEARAKVLEEALKSYACNCPGDECHGSSDCGETARAALKGGAA